MEDSLIVGIPPAASFVQSSGKDLNKGSNEGLDKGSSSESTVVQQIYLPSSVAPPLGVKVLANAITKVKNL